jgi:repressor LexA
VASDKCERGKLALDNLGRASQHVRANMNLTARQREVLDYIEGRQSRDGLMPSTREIQQHFGFASQTAVMNHLRALERKGSIVRQSGKARAMTLTSQLGRNHIIDVPILGSIAAGFPETAEQETLDTVSIDAVSAGLKKNSKMFALKVRGDSMSGAQISEGDLVILEQRVPQNGDIVAALIDGETTLKRFITTRGRPFLKAENPKYPDIHPVTELMVQGVMVALVRRCRR